MASHQQIARRAPSPRLREIKEGGKKYRCLCKVAGAVNERENVSSFPGVFYTHDLFLGSFPLNPLAPPRSDLLFFQEQSGAETTVAFSVLLLKQLLDRGLVSATIKPWEGCKDESNGEDKSNKGSEKSTGGGVAGFFSKRSSVDLRAGGSINKKAEEGEGQEMQLHAIVLARNKEIAAGITVSAMCPSTVNSECSMLPLRRQNAWRTEYSTMPRSSPIRRCCLDVL